MKSIKILPGLIFCFFFSTFSHSAVKIGTLFYDPPFIISTGEGFDIELSRLICKHLEIECELIPKKGPNQLYDALKNGEIDLAISGITVSPVRKADYIFSLPYLLSKNQFLTLKQNHFDSIDDLNGSKIGVIHDELSGGVLYSYLNKNYQNKFKIIEYETPEDMFAALHDKTISAVFLYRSDMNFWNQNGNDLFKPLGDVVVLGEGIAIMAKPQQAALIARINKILEKIEEDDSYLTLYQTYFSNQ
ncbi:transporter substrate-binding domain-containing protein [Legionella bozemanae]|uniref:transporter substrate-binding domain-containing protein n=1 Tax=Legionella bozemanae TaxID=447 RepID=UPI00399D35A0